MRVLLSLSAALALSACGSEPENPPADADTIAAPEAEAGTQIGEGPKDTAAAQGMIPVRFQGVWDYVEGTCDPASDLRMEIGGDEILFYESMGTVTSVQTEGDDIIVALAMEGEGEQWQQRTRFSLEGSGADVRLLSSDGDAPKSADDYPSKRCPA